jgi:DNA-binding Xre family transcriptional regulator
MPDEHISTLLHNRINEFLWHDAAEVAASLTSQAKRLLKELYPDRKTLVEELKGMVQESLLEIARELIYKGLGVKINHWGDGEVAIQKDNRGLRELLDRLGVNLDQAIKKLDLDTRMEQILTEELDQYCRSLEFEDSARSIARQKVREHVNSALSEAIQKVKLDQAKPAKPAKASAGKRGKR